MTSKITYEFPLNERIRVFIRLEQLFNQFNHFLTGDSVWDKRVAMSILLDIMSIFGRTDLKSELLKELDRQGKALSKLSVNQDVDAAILNHLVSVVGETSKSLYASSGKLGVHVMESDLIQSVSQRNSIPGGTSSFDLPEYHYWLEQDEALRLRDLQQWSSPLNDIRKAIEITLKLIRSSCRETEEIANAGFFQITMDHSQPYQLLKISLDRSLHYFAEISGGKHRCTIRFMVPSHDEKRPVQGQEDVPFTLSCCQFG